MSQAKRVLVINPDTNEVENCIIVGEEPISIPGRLLVDDEWGACPGDAWDPVQRRAYAVPKTIEVVGSNEPVQVLMDQRRAIIESRKGDLEQALIEGNLDAAMTIVLEVHRRLRELEDAIGPLKVTDTRGLTA